MPNRRNILTALAAIPALGPISALAAARLGYCGSCTGHGQCESHNCQNGQCRPTSNVCAGRKVRNKFVCKKGTAGCCKTLAGKKCDPI
jgi:hypothetical protein